MKLQEVILELTHINKDKSALLSPKEGRAIKEAIYWLTTYLGEIKSDPSR